MATCESTLEADTYVAVYRYQYDVRSMVLSSYKHNISCYYSDCKTCTAQTDAEIPQPGNQLFFMLHELVFLEFHSQFASYPYAFASYSYSCKILQPYVAATVRMHSNAVLSSTCALLMKTVTGNNPQLQIVHISFGRIRLPDTSESAFTTIRIRCERVWIRCDLRMTPQECQFMQHKIQLITGLRCFCISLNKKNIVFL